MKPPYNLTISLLAIGYLLLAAVNAQTSSQVILTWQANNFYPADYAGKALPTKNSAVTVSAELAENNKLSDLSQANFIWYLDEKFLSRGAGLKEINFTAIKSENDYHFVRAEINFKNKNYQASARIPISKYRLVIEAPYTGNAVKSGNDYLFAAIPYFFNVSSIADFDFSWQIGEKTTKTGSDNQLIFKIPSGAASSQIEINAFAQNRTSRLEIGSERIKLNILP